MPLILPPTDANIRTAATRLRLGDPVAFPTETVYGLGAHTMNPAAIDRLYELKGRPADNPLIAHVADRSAARKLVSRWDDRCELLATRFWPGPLTLVLPRADRVGPRATAGLPTIAVRCPSHPVALSLLGEFDGPVSAPSANRSGYVSPTTAQHVADDFAGQIDMIILEGGPCGGGIESTVLDLSAGLPRILRPGGVTIEQVREVIGDVEQPRISEQGSSPGSSMQHYSPRKPVELVDPGALSSHVAARRSAASVLCFDGSMVRPPHEAIVMPRSAESYAARLYDALRGADRAAASTSIIIELPPMQDGVWSAIHDRLRRAATER